MYQCNAAGSITICCYDKQHVHKHSDSKSKYINRTAKELNLRSGLLLNVKLQNVVCHRWWKRWILQHINCQMLILELFFYI